MLRRARMSARSRPDDAAGRIARRTSPLSRGRSPGGPSLERRTIHVRGSCRSRRAEFPDQRAVSGGTASRTVARRAAAARGRADRRRSWSSPRGAAVHRATDRAAGDVRRPGRHRHRERPPVRGAGASATAESDRGAGAADGDRRGAAGHRLVADRPAGGARRHRRERRAAVRAPSDARIYRRRRRLARSSCGGASGSPRMRRSVQATSDAAESATPSRSGRPSTGGPIHVPDVADRAETSIPTSARCQQLRPAHDARRSPLLREGEPSACSSSSARGAARSRPRRSRCWRRSRTRRSSPSRTPGCSRSSGADARADPLGRGAAGARRGRPGGQRRRSTSRRC